MSDASSDIHSNRSGLHAVAESGAEREREFSETMIECMPGIVYLYDACGKFLRWNKNFEAVSGYSADEIAKMSPLDFIAAGDRSLIEERIAVVFETGESAVEAPFLSKDGTQTSYYFTGRRVQFHERTCLVGVGIDISARRNAELALQQSETRFRTTLDSVLEGCQLLGFDWRYLYLNDAAAQHNRRPNPELLGRTMQEAWPGIENTRAYEIIAQCMESRVPAQKEVEFVFGDGTVGWFDLSILPTEEGILILTIEKTQSKLAENAFRELTASLEQRVAERTAELASALVRAEAADRLKSAFLATMSHELRTPLNSIIGFTGIVLKELAGPLNPEQARQLGMVRSSARHLLELINDVLDISKIEAGQLEVRSELFDLPETIRAAIDIVQPMVTSKGLKLVTEIPSTLPPMTSDRRRVEQILLNVLNNANKFTDRGHITLRVEVISDYRASKDLPPCSAVRMQVSDTGIGIKPDDLHHLFQPFRQLDSGLTRQHEGTGLGLAICRRLAGLLGGEITATSEWGRGSEFTVTLPLKHPSEPC